MEARRLGAHGPEVSRLSLGSWRTFERISREDGLAVMLAGREAGITFLDDARYNDETGTAPLATGYSEVVFGELFRAAGWPRDDTIVANKLWWEFWPVQSAAQELDASLGRMGLAHVDLIYSAEPPDRCGLDEVLRSVASLIAAGKARFWGVLDWRSSLVAEVNQLARQSGLPLPCAAQLPYNVVTRSPVEDADMAEALSSAGTGVVASFALAGGVLSGKYDRDAARGRATGTLSHPRVAPSLEAARELAALGRSLGAEAATLALAFALVNESVATVLFGATLPEQITANVAALDLVGRLDDEDVRRLQEIGRTSQGRPA